METRKTMDGRAGGLMVLLCLIWSLQQIALKATAQDAAPLFMIALRSGVAAVLVGALMLLRKEAMPVRGAWRPGLLVGALFASEFLLLGEALRLTSAAHASVFLYSAPFFAALGLHLKLPAERLVPLQWFGIALAFSGIAYAFLGGEVAAEGATSSLLGDFLALAAGAAWGATIVVIRCTSLSSVPATRTLFYQLIGGFALLLPATVLLGQFSINPTPAVIGNLVFQSVVVSFASFLAWFALLRRYLASRLGVFSFMTPLFGVMLGVWLLDERIESNFLAGAVLVLAGIVLVNGHGLLMQVLRPGRSQGRTG